MKIHVSENGSIVLSDVFNAIVIATDQGEFGVAQRDGGIEVMHKGELVYSSNPPTSSYIVEGIDSMTESP